MANDVRRGRIELLAALPLDVCLLFEALLTTTPDNYACASTDLNRLQPTSTDFNRLQACASTDFNRLTMPWYVRFTVAQHKCPPAERGAEGGAEGCDLIIMISEYARSNVRQQNTKLISYQIVRM